MFDRVTCISMKKTPKRWERFESDWPEDWPFAPVERVEAIEGKKVGAPDWWKQGAPAWGCYRSHLRIIEECLNDGTESVLLLEDDAICCDNFAERVQPFIENLPDDWEMLYLGGQHLHSRRHPPLRVNDHVVRPYNVNRTHAWALRGNGLRKVYRHLLWIQDWKKGHHVDHHLGRITQRRKMPCYAPTEFLIGQNNEQSTINFKKPPIRFWTASGKAHKTMFVMIVGLHRSGSSCLAGVCHRLGVHMGNKFVGCEPDGGYEAQELARKLEHAWPYPGVTQRDSVEIFAKKMQPWVTQKMSEAARSDTMAGAKYPHLCVYAPAIETIVGDQLLVVHIDRPLEESVQSLIRRSGHKEDHDILRKHQETFHVHKERFLESTAAPVHTVNYKDLVENTAETVYSLTDFLGGLNPEESMIQAAISYVNPELRHIKPEEISE